MFTRNPFAELSAFASPAVMQTYVAMMIVLVVAVLIVWFGWKNTLLDLGSFRMPSLIPLTVYTAIVPVAGVLIALFTIEQLVNGWKHGFEGPEDRDEIREAVL